MTEKELVEKILRDRAIINPNGTINEIRFRKLVGEPWIADRVKRYGWHEHPVHEEDKKCDIKAVQPVAEKIISEVEKPAEIVEKPVEIAVVKDEPSMITEDLPSVAPIVEEPVVIVEEKPTEAPADVVIEAAPVVEEPVVKTTRKKSTKK